MARAHTLNLIIPSKRVNRLDSLHPKRGTTAEADRPWFQVPPPLTQQPVRDRYWLHGLLFLATFACTSVAGVFLVQREILYAGIDGGWHQILDGLRFSFPLLFFLTVHEFGHYFAAKYHNVSVTLPYYIPSPLFFFPMNIGTFGAVIRIREPIPSTRKLFDIGVAGPLAGFVIAIGVLLYGLFTLPDWTYMLNVPNHEALNQVLEQTGGIFPPNSPPDPNAVAIYIGQTPLYWLLTQFFTGVPAMYEMYHYPVLFAGWLGLFFTALNLLPVGQLDGGHVLYALVGPKWHGILARGFVMILLLSAAIGYAVEIGPLLESEYAFGFLLNWGLLTAILAFFMHRIFRNHSSTAVLGVLLMLALVAFITQAQLPLIEYGYSGWFFWCLLIVLFIKIDHPPVLYFEPLTPIRRVLGILSLIIFVLCFSIKPIYVA